jgi:hypothetical protein
MKIKIKADIPNRWVPCFLAMLDRMEYLGIIGSSRNVTIYSDGDGDFRPKFKFPKKLIPLISKATIKSKTGGDYIYDVG